MTSAMSMGSLANDCRERYLPLSGGLHVYTSTKFLAVRGDAALAVGRDLLGPVGGREGGVPDPGLYLEGTVEEAAAFHHDHLGDVLQCTGQSLSMEGIAFEVHTRASRVAREKY